MKKIISTISIFLFSITFVGEVFAGPKLTMLINQSPWFDGFRKTLEMYDLPGHDRLRYSALDKRKEEASAIIYVIDASTIKQKLRESAEYLFISGKFKNPSGLITYLLEYIFKPPKSI